MGHGAKRAGILAACAVGALASFLTAATAQESRAGRTLPQIERDRRVATAEAERLRGQAAVVRRDVAALDQRLVEASRRRAEAEAAATDAEGRLAELRDRTASETVRYRNSREALESAVMAAAFASRDPSHRASRNGIFAAAAAPRLTIDLRQRRRALDENQALAQLIATETRVLNEAQAAIDGERAEIVSLLAQRRAAQTTLVADAAAADRRVRRLAQEATNLRQLAERVAQPRRSGGSSSGSGAAAPSVIPAAWLAPAEGRIIRAFGAQVAGGPAAQGVALRTRAGAQVVAPASGEIAYAGLFRSYGHVLILNLDGGYAVVLTGMDNVRAQLGERVIAGQMVGEMSSSNTPAPELYVEVRRNGRPVDPARWLSARGLTAEREAGGPG